MDGDNESNLMKVTSAVDFGPCSKLMWGKAQTEQSLKTNDDDV